MECSTAHQQNCKSFLRYLPWTRDTGQYLVSMGFFVVLCLMILTVVMVLSQLNGISHTMSIMVEETNTKVQAANSMRDAIRLRSDSLKKMQLSSDLFERDDELQRFYNYSGIYRIAREKLLSHKLNKVEQALTQRLTDFTRQAQPINDKAAELLMEDEVSDEIVSVIAAAESLQHAILQLLDELVTIENNATLEALDATNRENKSIRLVLMLLIGVALLISSLIALYVINNLTKKNREIEYQATHDCLTGLINRREFEHRVTEAMRSSKVDNVNHALMYIDLDQFKVVNDTCGHSAGDELLRQITHILGEDIRQTDTLGRLGGDEFGVLLNGCNLTEAALLGEKLKDVISGYRFSWSGKFFTIGASIGVVPITKDSNHVNDIFVAADEACYTAKENGRNLVHVYDPEDKNLQRNRDHFEWVARVNRALDENRLRLFIQPIFSINDREHFKYAEVLVRMIGRDGTLYNPGSFLPAAERYGRIIEVDKWVFTNTINWLEANQESCDYRLSINLSGHSIGNVEFRDYVKDTIVNSAIAPEQICFEITETAAIASFEAAITFITELKYLGCVFALDDFGSGLSSFGYLKQLPVDILKIDGAFIRTIEKDPLDYAMVKSINEIGHIMGIKTVAEFVETDSAIEKLVEIGVDFVQGFKLAEPSPLDYFEAKIQPALIAEDVVILADA